MASGFFRIQNYNENQKMPSPRSSGCCTVAKTDCIQGISCTPYIGFIFVGIKHRKIVPKVMLGTGQTAVPILNTECDYHAAGPGGHLPASSKNRYFLSYHSTDNRRSPAMKTIVLQILILPLGILISCNESSGNERLF